jgi:galactose mutarotase-like enzyme
LSGDFKEANVKNHSLRLKNSRWYLETDNNLIPTGVLNSVKGTDLDFLAEFTELGDILDSKIAGASFKGIDHALTIEGQKDILAPEKVKLAAELRHGNT